MNDARVLRDRMRFSDDALDRAAVADPFASAAAVGVTTMVTTYPTTANAYYAFNPGIITGLETEGTAATPAPDATTVYMALNVGSGIPPIGTPIVIHAVGGRWVFRFDGCPTPT